VDIACDTFPVQDDGMSRSSSAVPHRLSIATFETEATQGVESSSHERVRDPLTIASRRATAEPAVIAFEVLPDLQAPAARKFARIAIKTNGRILLIDPAEILVAEAQGNYVLLQQSRGSHMLRGKISILAAKLEAYGLIRIHRSVLVNADHVEGIEPLVTGEYLLRMKGGKEYKVTRTYKQNLHLLAATWIGAGSFFED
jgi:DNA-binding LytR/AlgR family response regulator